ncbi:MAG: hypothetical protein ABSG13_16650 [Bryobacteraceae bacterium]
MDTIQLDSVVAPAPKKQDFVAMFISALIRVVWSGALLCALYAVVDFRTSWSAQTGAPQQAALAAYELAWAVIPYCLARSFAAVVGKSQG